MSLTMSKNLVTKQHPALVTRRAVLAVTAAALMAPLAGALAARGPVPATLNDQQKTTLARVETYLNSIRTLRSRFLQVAENGAPAEGDIFISRPGLMRIEYDPQ